VRSENLETLASELRRPHAPKRRIVQNTYAGADMTRTFHRRLAKSPWEFGFDFLLMEWDKMLPTKSDKKA